MNKTLRLILSFLFVLGLVACNKDTEPEVKPEEPPMLTDVVFATDTAYFKKNALVKNSLLDQSVQLQYCINYATKNGKKLFIDAGVYIITKSIILPEKMTLLGDLKNPTILRNNSSKNITFEANKNINTYKKDIKISGLFFDGISFYTWMVDGFEFSKNVVYNPKFIFPINLSSGKNQTLKHNVFMRDITHAPKGDSSRFVIVNGSPSQKMFVFMEKFEATSNLFGFKFDELPELKKLASPELLQTIERVEQAQVKKTLNAGGNEQNYFTTGINSFYMLKGAVIKLNIFCAHWDNPNRADVVGDHITYLRGSQDVEIVANYARGFHNGPAGGFKFKSGRNISIINNYLVNTGIILYTTAEFTFVESFQEKRQSVLENLMVYGNVFDFTHWDKAYQIGIEYNDVEAKSGVGSNGVFMNNVYKNYAKIDKLKRRNLLLNSGNTSIGFNPKNTFVKDNIRDDSEDKVLYVQFWKPEDYLLMPKSYKDVYVPKNFDQNIKIKIK